MTRIEDIRQPLSSHGRNDTQSRGSGLIVTFKKWRGNSLSRITIPRVAVMSCIAVVFAVVFASLAISGFEAHVINVTAQIEKLHCKEFDVKSLDFWKSHEEKLKLPQQVGDIFVDTPKKTKKIFNASQTEQEKLRAELFTLKLNITYFAIGDAFVPGEMNHVSGLAHDADALLLKHPPASADKLKSMRERIEEVNAAKKLSACPDDKPRDPCKHDDDNHDGHGDDNINHHDNNWDDTPSADALTASSSQLSALSNNGNNGGDDGHGGDGGTIHTGDGCAHAEVINDINHNEMVIDLGGGSVTVTNTNTAFVINSVNASASTGGNTANGGAEATSTPSPIPSSQFATATPSVVPSATAAPASTPSDTPTPSSSASPIQSSSPTPIATPAPSEPMEG